MLKNIKYQPSENALRVLIKGNILVSGESSQHMFERVVTTLFSVEKTFGIAKKDTDKAKEDFARYMAAKMYTPETLTLTNAGEVGYEHAALSSHAIIPVDLRRKQESKKRIKAYYWQNMGSGFDLTRSVSICIRSNFTIQDRNRGDVSISFRNTHLNIHPNSNTGCR